jgi:hypothetical protein
MSLSYDETNLPIAFDRSSGEVIYFDEPQSGDGDIKEAHGTFDIIPDISQGYEIIYVFGASGSGKSYFAAGYALTYRKMFPHKNIFIFSKKASDPSFERRINIDGKNVNIENILKIRRVPIDDDFLDKKIDIATDFSDSLVIFDDFLYHEDKKIVEKLCHLVVDIITLGRQSGIYCVITAHLLYAMKNRDLYSNIQNELHKLVWFSGVNTYQLRYSLKNYWGIPQKMIEGLLQMEPRKKYSYTCLNRCPLYAISSHRCVLLS